MTALLFGLGAGFGVAAWKQLPPIEPAPARSGLLLWLLVALCVAYTAGRGRRGRTVTATATAVASASSSAQGGSVVLNVHTTHLDQLTSAPWRQDISAGPARRDLAHSRDVDAVRELGWLDGDDCADDLDPVEVRELAGNSVRHSAADASRHSA